MRRMAALAAISVLGISGSAAVGIAAGRTPPAESMTADIERDLEMASSAAPRRTAVVSALEQGRSGAPSGNSKGARMAVPTQKRAPTAAPSRRQLEAPVEHENTHDTAPDPEPAVSQPETVVASAAGASTEAAPPDLSYPTPAEAQSAGTGTGSGSGAGVGSSGTGNGRRGSGAGAAAGAVLGAILRGATVGVDHCEPPSRRRRGTEGRVIGAIGGVLIGGNRIGVRGLP